MFEVRTKQKTPRGQDKSSTLYLVAPTQADADAWVEAIQNNMNALNEHRGSTGGDISLAVPSRDSGRSKSPVRSFVKSLGALVGIGGDDDDGGDGGDDDDNAAIVEEDAELRRRKYEARAYIDSFDADTFKSSLESAMVVVKRVLDTTKNPKPINDVPHAYADKFSLAERATHTAIRAVLVPLEQLGFDRKSQSRFRETVQLKKRPVELVLQATEKCKFLRRTEREEEDAVRYVSEYSVGRLVSAITDRITHKTVRTIVEYHWRFDYEYRLVVRSGKDEHTLMRGTRHCELITPDDSSPRPEHSVRDEISLNLTWLLQQLRSGKKVKKRNTDGSKSPRRSRSKSPRPSTDDNSAAAAAAAAAATTAADDDDEEEDVVDASAADDERAPTRFVIERSVASCLTPRRNCDVEDALTFFYRAFNFCNEVTGYLAEVFSLHDDNVDVSTFDVDTMFSPVVVLLDKGRFLPASDVDALLAEQRRSIDEKLAAVKKSVGSASGLVGFDEARVVCMLAHAGVIGEQYSNTIDAVEALLEQQLVAALGRTIKPVDFDAYMQFHCRKLFVPSRAPAPFVYGVRRDATGCVEGVLSIDVDRGDGALPQPLHTLAAVHRNARNWSFALGAATRAAINGDLYVHAALLHSFAPEPASSSLHLHARARQFSSFILLCGSIIGKGELLPTHALYVANKTELDVVLETTALPSAKAFKEAVESMSPEMQRFAKAFRAMQLESTLFGVAVVQVKPQLELLLNLVPRTLDKEIELTQKLLDLMVTYQIPSDMLAYNEALGEVAMPPVPPPLPQTSVLCNSRHPLTWSERSDGNYARGWVCDKCSKHAAADVKHFLCRACGYDLCDQCAPARKPLPSAALDETSDDGSVEDADDNDDIGVPDSDDNDKSIDAELVREKKKRVRQVRAHVAKLEEVIRQMKADELADALQQRDFARPPVERKKPVPTPERHYDSIELAVPTKKKGGFLQKFKNVMQQPKKLMKKTRKPRIDGDFMSSSAMRDEAPGAGAGAASMSMDMDDNDAAGDMREMAAAPEPSGGEGGNGDGGAASDEKPSGEQQQRERGDGDADGGVEFDVTQLPTRIDGKLEELDEEGAVAPTTIKLADDWTKKSFASLLANEQVELLQKDELRTEKNKAFDMLDALSRSGDLELRFCELHVVILATHMFAQSLMHTVARGNVNPIEKAEKSNLILASELFGEKPAQLVNKSELERVRMYSSNIFN
jgi:hypothetical protein